MIGGLFDALMASTVEIAETPVHCCGNCARMCRYVPVLLFLFSGFRLTTKKLPPHGGSFDTSGSAGYAATSSMRSGAVPSACTRLRRTSRRAYCRVLNGYG